MKNFFLFYLPIMVFLTLTTTSCSKDDDEPIEIQKSDSELLSESYSTVLSNIVGGWQEEAHADLGKWKIAEFFADRWTFNSDGTALKEDVYNVKNNELGPSKSHWKYRIEKNTSIDMSVCTQNRESTMSPQFYYPYSTGAVILYLTCLDYADSDEKYFIEIKEDGKLYSYNTFISSFKELGVYTFGEAHKMMVKR